MAHPSSLTKLIGALKSTGGSPGIGKISKKDKKIVEMLAVTKGSGKKRLMQAYSAARRSNSNLQDKFR